MEEFRIGLDRSVGLLIACRTHNLTGGGEECQGQVPLHSLSNVKSEERDSTLSTGIYGTGTYVSVLE